MAIGPQKRKPRRRYKTNDRQKREFVQDYGVGRGGDQGRTIGGATNSAAQRALTSAAARKPKTRSEQQYLYEKDYGTVGRRPAVGPGFGANNRTAANRALISAEKKASDFQAAKKRYDKIGPMRARGKTTSMDLTGAVRNPRPSVKPISVRPGAPTVQASEERTKRQEAAELAVSMFQEDPRAFRGYMKGDPELAGRVQQSIRAGDFDEEVGEAMRHYIPGGMDDSNQTMVKIPGRGLAAHGKDAVRHVVDNLPGKKPLPQVPQRYGDITKSGTHGGGLPGSMQAGINALRQDKKKPKGQPATDNMVPGTPRPRLELSRGMRTAKKPDAAGAIGPSKNQRDMHRFGLSGHERQGAEGKVGAEYQERVEGAAISGQADIDMERKAQLQRTAQNFGKSVHERKAAQRELAMMATVEQAARAGASKGAVGPSIDMEKGMVIGKDGKVQFVPKHLMDREGGGTPTKLDPQQGYDMTQGINKALSEGGIELTSQQSRVAQFMAEKAIKEGRPVVMSEILSNLGVEPEESAAIGEARSSVEAAQSKYDLNEKRANRNWLGRVFTPTPSAEELSTSQKAVGEAQAQLDDLLSKHDLSQQVYDPAIGWHRAPEGTPKGPQGAIGPEGQAPVPLAQQDVGQLTTTLDTDQSGSVDENDHLIAGALAFDKRYQEMVGMDPTIADDPQMQADYEQAQAILKAYRKVLGEQAEHIVRG